MANVLNNLMGQLNSPGVTKVQARTFLLAALDGVDLAPMPKKKLAELCSKLRVLKVEVPKAHGVSHSEIIFDLLEEIRADNAHENLAFPAAPGHPEIDGHLGIGPAAQIGPAVPGGPVPLALLGPAVPVGPVAIAAAANVGPHAPAQGPEAQVGPAVAVAPVAGPAVAIAPGVPTGPNGLSDAETLRQELSEQAQRMRALEELILA